MLFFLPLAGKFRTSRDSGTEGRPWLSRIISKYLLVPIKLPVGWVPYLRFLKTFYYLLLTKTMSASLLLLLFLFNHFASDTTMKKTALEQWHSAVQGILLFASDSRV